MSYDKDKDALMNTFSPLHGHPLQHQLLYNSSPNPTSPTMHHTPSPSQSPAPPSPSLSGFHNVPLYGGLPRFPVQLNLAQKLQQQQQQTPLNHATLSHHAALLGQTPQSVTGSLASPASINSGSQPQTLDALSGLSTPTVAPNTPHYQKQLTYAQMSRLAASPHHHARTAAAAARTATNASVSSAVPITDPNNPTKILNGMPLFGDKRKDQQQQQQQQIDNGVPVRVTQTTQASWTTLDMGGMGLKNVSRELFRYSFLTILYINHNSLTYLSPEISRLVHLRTLDASGNKLTNVPPELGMLVQLKDLLLFDNGITVLPNELGTLYQVENLGLEGNPLQEPLKGMLQKEGSQAVIGYLRDCCPVPLPPPEREWILLEGDVNDDPKDKFTVFTYNILCERCATTQLYGYTPSWALSWEYRKVYILQEVLSYNADIVCLQEVEISQYEEYFRDELKREGDYDSIFWPKSRAKTMAEKERRSVDGCAIFYKMSRFECIEKQHLEFNQIALSRPDFKKTDDIFNRVMTKDNIAVIALLENKETHARIVVSNSHIHWDPYFADVKLVQIAMLMDELDKLATRWAAIPPTDPTSTYNYAANPTKLPTLICGDFNSIPNSGVYEFLSRGTVKQDHEDFGDHVYGTYTTDGLAHRHTLKSAYSHVGELPFTNFTPGFSGVIDYIWYSSNTLSVAGLLGPVDKDYLTKIVGFPNAHFPSDHICILAEFKVRAPPPKDSGRASPVFGPSSNSGKKASTSSGGGGGGGAGKKG